MEIFPLKIAGFSRIRYNYIYKLYKFNDCIPGIHMLYYKSNRRMKLLKLVRMLVLPGAEWAIFLALHMSF